VPARRGRKADREHCSPVRACRSPHHARHRIARSGRLVATGTGSSTYIASAALVSMGNEDGGRLYIVGRGYLEMLN